MKKALVIISILVLLAGVAIGLVNSWKPKQAHPQIQASSGFQFTPTDSTAVLMIYGYDGYFREAQAIASIYGAVQVRLPSAWDLSIYPTHISGFTKRYAYTDKGLNDLLDTWYVSGTDGVIEIHPNKRYWIMPILDFNNTNIFGQHDYALLQYYNDIAFNPDSYPNITPDYSKAIYTTLARITDDNYYIDYELTVKDCAPTNWAIPNYEIKYFNKSSPQYSACDLVVYQMATRRSNNFFARFSLLPPKDWWDLEFDFDNIFNFDLDNLTFDFDGIFEFFRFIVVYGLGGITMFVTQGFGYIHPLLAICYACFLVYFVVRVFHMIKI